MNPLGHAATVFNEMQDVLESTTKRVQTIGEEITGIKEDNGKLFEHNDRDIKGL